MIGCKQPLRWNSERRKDKVICSKQIDGLDSYLKVCDKNRSAGIDKETIEIVLIPYKLERFLILISSDLGIFRHH